MGRGYCAAFLNYGSNAVVVPVVEAVAQGMKPFIELLVSNKPRKKRVANG